MKKILSLFLVFLLIISTISLGTTFVNAEEQHKSGFSYSIVKGKATITDCNTSISGDITIPSTLGGYPVTTIGDGAFHACYELTSVTIPDSVTGIGDYSFYTCKSLKSVIIPEGVTSIGNHAFAYCSSLTNITIPDSVTSIGFDAFYGCTSLTSAIIGNSIKKISSSLFDCCTSLTNVIIPNSVKSINFDAFGNCISLRSITIPNSVTSIHDDAFSGCSSNLTIYGYAESVAENFAKENNIKFILISATETPTNPNNTQPSIKPTSCPHRVVTKNTKKATYFAKGYTGDKVCSKCGVVVSRGKDAQKLKLKTPKFSLSGGKKQFKVKYTKVANATGFEIKYKLGKGKFKVVKVTTKKSMTKVIKKLKKGSYKVQVRAVIKSGKKTAYSNWSSLKTVKVK